MKERIRYHPQQNLVKGNFAIDLGNPFEAADLTITSIDGKLIHASTYRQQQQIELSIADQAAGLYLVTISAGDQRAVIRLVKE